MIEKIPPKGNMDACGYVSAVATPEILEAKIDTTLSYFADLSYFFGPAADSIQIDKVQYPDRTVVERCAMIRDSGDKTELVLEMWSRVKGDNLVAEAIALLNNLWCVPAFFPARDEEEQARRVAFMNAFMKGMGLDIVLDPQVSLETWRRRYGGSPADGGARSRG